MRYQEVSGRALAFLGDAVWSLLVREDLIRQGYSNGKVLQKKSVEQVNAKAQARAYDALHQEGFFTEEEEQIFKRGRNDSAGTVPRSTPAPIYRKSTGFEAIIGALQLMENSERIQTIWDKVRTH
ncbi:MAG: Mini-ribonuclease 3 [Erysipelotrichia bacterium]|nr:Mini-ribonuclease 3 [Erysipelotrichia bacterium]